MAHLLIFSRDPGPTNYLVALMEALSSKPRGNEVSGLAALRGVMSHVTPHVFAREPGLSFWRVAGFQPTEWRGSSDEDADALLAETSATLVLTGSSDIEEPGDHLLWAAARRRGVESHVVIDRPVNLDVRFRRRDGSASRPDWFYVVDEDAAAQLAATGIPANSIRMIGELHHARVLRLAEQWMPADVASLRRTWGAGPGSFVALFASECVAEMTVAGCPSPYDEYATLDKLIGQLRRGERPDGGRVDPSNAIVVVRPHPRDTAGKYDAIAKQHPALPRVLVSAEEGAELAMLAADMVVGMNSSLLHEAVALGRPTMSLVGIDISAENTHS